MENECEALPGVAYPGVRDNCSTLNTKTGYDDDDDDTGQQKHFQVTTKLIEKQLSSLPTHLVAVANGRLPLLSTRPAGLPSQLPTGRYQIILLGERGTCV